MVVTNLSSSPQPHANCQRLFSRKISYQRQAKNGWWGPRPDRAPLPTFTVWCIKAKKLICCQNLPLILLLLNMSYGYPTSIALLVCFPPVFVLISLVYWSVWLQPQGHTLTHTFCILTGLYSRIRFIQRQRFTEGGVCLQLTTCIHFLTRRCVNQWHTYQQYWARFLWRWLMPNVCSEPNTNKRRRISPCLFHHDFLKPNLTRNVPQVYQRANDRLLNVVVVCW